MSVIDIAKSHFENIGVQSMEVPEWTDEDGKAVIIFWNPITLSEKNKLLRKSETLSFVKVSLYINGDDNLGGAKSLYSITFGDRII